MNHSKNMGCDGIIGFLLGHNYKPVYDEEISMCNNPEIIKEVTDTHKLIMGNSSVEGVLFQLKNVKQNYVQHVCKRCGDVIKRS